MALGVSNDDLEAMGDDNLGEKYLTSLYWAFTTMTTVGYGDITPKNEYEYIFAATTMIIGATVFGYVVGNVAQMMDSLNVGLKRKKDYLRKVKNYMRERKISKMLQRGVMTYFENILEERTAFDEMKILQDLPEAIRTDVLLHVHSKTIPYIAIFKGQTKSFIGTMLTLLRPQHVAARDFIYHEGESGFDMYFLVRGECASGYYLGNILSEMKLSIYTPGSFFGEAALIDMGKRKTAVMAQTDCYILALARSDIDWLVSTYPHWAKILLTCLKQNIQNKKRIKSWGGLRNKLKAGIMRKKMKLNFKISAPKAKKTQGSPYLIKSDKSLNVGKKEDEVHSSNNIQEHEDDVVRTPSKEGAF
eukprot:g11374.t1